MPGYRSHIAGGAITFCGIVLLVSKTYPPTPITALQWFLLTIVGALFPDVDIKSRGQGIFYRVILLCLILLYLQKNWHLFAATSFLAMIPLLVRHRGLFHELWFVVAVPFALACFTMQSFPACKTILLLDATFFAAGAVSHIVLDRIT
ncbi:MAG: hypothetical protein ACJAZS_000435 [Alteromonas naphthalenivorans]|jgi:hypothetical protein